MARPAFDEIVNMDVPDNKRRVIRSIGTLTGIYEIDIHPKRNTRSLAQLRYYFAEPVAQFARFLAEQEYEGCSKDVAHEILKGKLLMVDVVNPATGEVITSRVRSTGELTTLEMTEYIEKARHWLADFFGVQTSDPGSYGIDVSAVNAEAQRAGREVANV